MNFLWPPRETSLGAKRRGSFQVHPRLGRAPALSNTARSETHLCLSASSARNESRLRPETTRARIDSNDMGHLRALVSLFRSQGGRSFGRGVEWPSREVGAMKLEKNLDNALLTMVEAVYVSDSTEEIKKEVGPVSGGAGSPHEDLAQHGLAMGERAKKDASYFRRLSPSDRQGSRESCMMNPNLVSARSRLATDRICIPPRYPSNSTRNKKFRAHRLGKVQDRGS